MCFRGPYNCHDVQPDRNTIRALATLPILLVVRLPSTLASVEDALSYYSKVRVTSPGSSESDGGVGSSS